ncbi:unnamed protein product [Rotaria magnacalcarata]|uniref:Transposase n=1 Tax=Rotaria magnacalcarata TaxID=392030 RepID=A0A816YXV8_9BILA|nr:unnamed protein product [Rotaria magnacalcarata]CAF2168079.1 unnamed protein product [Rotaria magnacalcarata]
MGLHTIERWCKLFRETGSVDLKRSPGRPRTISTKATIQMVTRKMNRKIPLSAAKMVIEMNLSETTVWRVLKEALKLKPYKMVVKPSLTDQQKESRKRFENWMRTNFGKEDTMKILFSDEKMFDIDGVYNSQNERIWAANRAEVDAKGGIKRKRKYSQKVMIWLAVCSQGGSPLVIFEGGTIDHDRYINEVLPVALQYGNTVFGNHWTFQQDGAKPIPMQKLNNGVQKIFLHL